MTGQPIFYNPVKQLFLILSFQFHNDSDFCNQSTNAAYSCYKTSICSPGYPAGLHTGSGSAASAPVPASCCQGCDKAKADIF